MDDAERVALHKAIFSFTFLIIVDSLWHREEGGGEGEIEKYCSDLFVQKLFGSCFSKIVVVVDVVVAASAAAKEE